MNSMSASAMWPVGILVLFLGIPWGVCQGELSWCTYLGTDVGENAMAVATGPDATIYLTGYTSSPGFPTTVGAYDTSYSNGKSNVFVTRMSPYGSELAYSTYLGGGGNISDTQEGWDIVVDAAGHAYVTGTTSTSAFPVTSGAFDTSFNGQSDVFVAKLSPQGNELRWATFLGGRDLENAYGLALDGQGGVYISGNTNSEDFPITTDAFDTTYNRGSYDAFLAKLNNSGSELLYATYFGGTNWDYAQDVEVDDDGSMYLAGRTGSGNLPTTPGAWDADLGGAADGFVAKFDPSGSEADYITYLGGDNWDQIEGLAVDQTGSAYVTGYTKSTDFPVTPGSYDPQHDGVNDDVFVTKLNPQGTDLVYSSFLGGSNGDYGHDIAIGGAGQVCLVGETKSDDFPTTPGAFDRTYNGGFDDAFVAVLNGAGSDLVYSTFLGGSDGSGDRGNAVAIDHQGHACAVGRTRCTDFPATSGAFDDTYNGSWDVWVAKLSLGLTPVETAGAPPDGPEEFVLHPNFPNPFNACTEIGYQLPVDAPVALKIYNIRGQQVATLVDGIRPAGQHRLRWNADGLASGIYFCRLQAGDVMTTRKMVLVR
jgi:hypothetical protein